MASRITTFLIVLIVTGTLVAGLIVGAQRDEADGPVDLIITNGKVYTARDGVFAEAVAVRGNKILRVGSNRAIKRLRRPQTVTLDAHGAAVLPGFNDSHFHMLSGGLSLAHLDLLERDDARSDSDRHPRLRGGASRTGVDSRARLVLRAVCRRPAHASATGPARARPAGLLHGVRRAHGVGQQQGTGRGGHHAPDAKPQERHDRERRANRTADRRAQGRRDAPDEQSTATGHSGRKARGAATGNGAAHTPTG